MIVTAEQVKHWIEQGLPNCTVTVDGDGRHFNAIIVCTDFIGKNSMQRHRMVYAALGDRMREQIHALSLKTLTPDENK
ncbi:MAG: BolA family transcriptional regulator [Coxiella sp. RIFCSPHIGHO2_12_FULL_42_15]|nr:MAG: BolA family transcriptional regulator [Coxiella sp. RIFCSPHIGHO2_12_FULL_42_15]